MAGSATPSSSASTRSAPRISRVALNCSPPAVDGAGMRCYLVEKRITSLSDELAGYAFSMFHGSARRRGSPYPAKHYRFGVRTPHALHLTLNVRQTAGIIAPHLAWVVSEPVREVLDLLPRVKLASRRGPRLPVDPPGRSLPRRVHALSPRLRGARRALPRDPPRPGGSARGDGPVRRLLERLASARSGRTWKRLLRASYRAGSAASWEPWSPPSPSGGPLQSGSHR